MSQGNYSNIMVLMGVMVLLIGVQIILARQENPWLGRIIPFLLLIPAVMLSVGRGLASSDFMVMVGTLLLFSLPAGITYGIYLACRSGCQSRKNQELERMKLKDL